MFLDRAGQAIGEDCLGDFEPEGAAKVLTEDENSHSNGNFLRGNQVLHGYERLYALLVVSVDFFNGWLLRWLLHFHIQDRTGFDIPPTSQLVLMLLEVIGDHMQLLSERCPLEPKEDNNPVFELQTGISIVVHDGSVSLRRQLTHHSRDHS